jgi:serine/threonine protein phosphatase 1
MPAGIRVYAVGDIHGRLDLLDTLLAQIESDNAARPAAESILIFLGDLVDRGPDSAGVVQRLIDLAARVDSIRFLLGNHEEVFLKALSGDQKALSFFIRIGGKSTILSYGVSEQQYRESDFPALLELMREQVPATHIEFLRTFEDMIILGDYAFVHAGVRPGVELADQSAPALRWIREEFLDHNETLEKIIVHGHTIRDEVEERVCRIGIDTGAYASGKLTAMGFEGQERWILQTNARPGTVIADESY